MYPLAKRLLGMDAERRALERTMKEAQLAGLKSRHAADLLLMEKSLQLLRLEADSEGSSHADEKVRPSAGISSAW